MITLLLIAMLSMPVYATAEHHTDEDIDILANIIWHEARGIEADVELACVAWTVCNRVDAGYGTLREVMTAPYQFAYVAGKTFEETDPVYARCREIAADVLERRGQAFGVSTAMAIFFTVLLDKHGATAEELQVFWREVCDLSESITKGYVSASDLRDTLAKEYGIEV